MNEILQSLDMIVEFVSTFEPLEHRERIRRARQIFAVV
jgi:hypothetical protein